MRLMKQCLVFLLVLGVLKAQNSRGTDDMLLDNKTNSDCTELVNKAMNDAWIIASTHETPAQLVVALKEFAKDTTNALAICVETTNPTKMVACGSQIFKYVKQLVVVVLDHVREDLDKLKIDQKKLEEIAAKLSDTCGEKEIQ